MFHIAALYRFADLPQYRGLRDRLYGEARKQRIKGTLLLAEEGINGTLACWIALRPCKRFWARCWALFLGLRGLEAKWSEARAEPFRKLKVRLKQEIVTLGVPGTRPHVSWWSACGFAPVGCDFERSAHHPDRHNDYEVALGTFQGAAKSPKLPASATFLLMSKAS